MRDVLGNNQTMKQLAVLIATFSLVLGLRAFAGQSFEIHDVGEGGNPAIAFDKKGQLHLALGTHHNNSNLSDIRYAKSIDGARTWTSPFTVSNPGKSSLADIVVDTKGIVDVVWGYTSSVDNIVGLFLARSLDEGKTWDRAINISNTPDESGEPDVAVGPDDAIHVVWTDKSAGGKHPQICYSFSKDSGATWSKAENASRTSGTAGEPAIAVGEDGTVYVAWSETSLGGDHPDIYFASNTSGVWNRSVNISNSSYATSHPDISCGDKGKIHLCWAESAGGDNGQDICYVLGDSHGHFGRVLDLSDTAGISRSPALVTDLGRVAVVWSHCAKGSTKSEILGRASIDNGKHFSPAVSFSNKEDNSIHPDVAISGPKVFVVWEDSSPAKSIVKSTSVEIEVVSGQN
jgi:BNR repeat-like domain